jgi:hypothetical protein
MAGPPSGNSKAEGGGMDILPTTQRWHTEHSGRWMSWSLTKISFNRKKRSVTEVWRGIANDAAVHRIKPGKEATKAMKTMKAMKAKK